MLKIFLVEDSPLVRLRLAALIRPVAHASVVGQAADAGTALTGIANSCADLVIVDLRLAGSNGLELVSQLSHGTRKVITIVLTNYSDQAFRTASFAAGADYFFDKTNEFDLARDTIAHIARARSDKLIE
jgi:two-component system, NarL family, response regulator DevR